MSRAPRLRVTRSARRLACGHHVGKGVTIARKHRTWLCPACQPWISLRTVAEVLQAARDGEGSGSRSGW